MEDLISVIMSTYNEPVSELRESIESVLKQTYSNIEFIIVIDNPNNEELSAFIYSLDDPRIRVIKNDRNIGLVNSLNKAICQSKGEYLARMDADDICKANRLKLQKDYLEKNNLDLVGGSVCLIDENGNYISKLHFPCKQYLIKRFLKWGNCIPHPTWLVRKEVYTKLNGYRDVPRCEDYDFVCRSVQNHFKVGNVNDFILKYRIRSDSVSNSNKVEQYILRRFISKNRKIGITEREIRDYLDSDLYYREIAEYEKFQKIKNKIKTSPNIADFVKLCGNVNTYYWGIEKVCLKIRNLV